MKKIVFLFVLLLALCGCNDYVPDDILGRINIVSSLTFIPRYEDGKMTTSYNEATNTYYIESDFKVQPKGMADKIVKTWKVKKQNVTAEYTTVITRSTALSSMTVLNVSSDTEDVLTVRLAVPDEMTDKLEQLRISLTVTTNNIAVSSEYIPVYSAGCGPDYIPDSNPAPATIGNLVYVWGDEFNTEGVGVDETLWGFEEGFIRGNEKQYYQKDNATVTGGRLLITGRQERVRNAFYDAGSGDYRKNTEYSEYTSSSLLGKQKKLFLFGRIEVRAKITPANGAFPAIWTCGYNKDWPQNGEIDIMEYYLTGGKPVLTSNFCVGGDQNGSDGYWAQNWKSFFTPLSYYTAKDADWINKYHVYRMDWNDKEIQLYVDDELKNTVDITSFKNWDGSVTFHNPQFIMLNLAIKDHGAGIDSGQKFEVDYFRVYQKCQDLIAPTPVTNLAAMTSATSCALSWDASQDEHLYRYDIYKNGTSDGYFVGSTGNTSFTVSKLSADVTAIYYVKALDESGNYSTPVSIEATTQTISGEPVAGKYYQLVNYNSGKVLIPEAYDTDAGSIIQTESTGAEWEKWELVSSTSNSNWILKNKYNSHTLRYEWVDNTTDGDSCIQGGYMNADWDSRERWILEVQTGENAGLYKIKNEFGNRYMDINGASQDNGAKLIMWTGSDGKNQLWEFREVK